MFEIATIDVIERMDVTLIKTDKPFELLRWNRAETTASDHQEITGSTSLNAAVSSSWVRGMRAYPWAPLRVQNQQLVHALHPYVYNYMRDNGLYMFSRDSLNKSLRHNLWAALNVCVVLYEIFSPYL